MQATTDCSSPHVSSPSPAAELPESCHAAEKAPERAPKESPGTSPRRPSNAFTDSFLVRARRLAPPSSASSALLAGPWEVEEIEAGDHRVHAVVRRDEPIAEGGTAIAVLLDRASALLTAAALPALGTPNHLRLGLHRKRLGVPLHDGKSFLGHLARPEPGLLPRLHALRSIQANPDALAQVLESLGPEGLALLGRALARRVDGVG
jgi:hypothetical protein